MAAKWIGPPSRSRTAFQASIRRLVDAVELVAALVDVLEPVPLGHRGLDERRRGVGVVLQHLRRADAVEREVEPAVDRRLVVLPRADDVLLELLGDLKNRPNIRLSMTSWTSSMHMSCRVVGRQFDGVDLVRGELVAGGLVPVRFAAEGVVVEAVLLDPLLPVGRGSMVSRRMSALTGGVANGRVNRPKR